MPDKPPAKGVGRNYVPTGRPPGRPRKDGQPKSNENPDGTPKPKTVKARPDTAKVAGHPEGVPAGHPKLGVFPICKNCHPDGWPEGWSGTSCPHGTWARPPQLRHG